MNGFESAPASPDAASGAKAAQFTAEYLSQRQREPTVARATLLASLCGHDDQDWLACIRILVLHGRLDTAEIIASQALSEHPRSADVKRALAGIHRQTQRNESAEILLRDLLSRDPGDAAAAFALAQILKEDGRMAAMAQVMRACFQSAEHDADLAIRAIELLDSCDRKHDAAAIADSAIIAAPIDARLHAYAGTMQLQLGKFERARAHYLFALQHDRRACEWHVPHGLASAQRYTSVAHPDFALFHHCLQRTDLSDTARAKLLFAVGKAYDDIGDYGQATHFWRKANSLAHAQAKWSRKSWRRAADSRLSAKPVSLRLEPSDWQPIFVVGMPRSGTTLVAELLARHPQVCNRGESPWLARIAQKLGLAGRPTREQFEQAAAAYAAQLRQDDADSYWVIDKQPLNFRYVDLVLALWPTARIVYCRRSARDTALSLWSQSFVDDEQAYAYDFADIAAVMRDCERMMAHWTRLHRHSIFEVHYERLASNPDQVMAELRDGLGLPVATAMTKAAPSSISSASLWQARQPVYTRSVERWRHYAPYLPELLKFLAG